MRDSIAEQGLSTSDKLDLTLKKLAYLESKLNWW